MVHERSQRSSTWFPITFATTHTPRPTATVART
jgi:hypothetical protein